MQLLKTIKVGTKASWERSAFFAEASSCCGPLQLCYYGLLSFVEARGRHGCRGPQQASTSLNEPQQTTKGTAAANLSKNYSPLQPVTAPLQPAADNRRQNTHISYIYPPCFIQSMCVWFTHTDPSRPEISGITGRFSLK